MAAALALQKPPQENFSRWRRRARRNRCASPDRVKRKSRYRLRRTSGAPVSANGGRQAGAVYITGHRVGGGGPYHLALEYTEGGDPHWISAGVEDGQLVSGQDLQRPTDRPPLNITIGEVQPPAGTNAGGYFARLQQADMRYCDCLQYGYKPGIGNTYNSNGYIRGLVEATGGRTSVNFADYYGGSYPVPPLYFGRP